MVARDPTETAVAFRAAPVLTSSNIDPGCTAIAPAPTRSAWSCPGGIVRVATRTPSRRSSNTTLTLDVLRGWIAPPELAQAKGMEIGRASRRAATVAPAAMSGDANPPPMLRSRVDALAGGSSRRSSTGARGVVRARGRSHGDDAVRVVAGRARHKPQRRPPSEVYRMLSPMLYWTVGS